MVYEQPSPESGLRIFVRAPDGLPYNVVVSYLDKCRNSMQALKDAIERADYEFVSVYSHRMKGAGGAYGFPKLTQIGGFIEQAARVKDAAEIRHGAAALEAHLELLEVVEN